MSPKARPAKQEFARSNYDRRFQRESKRRSFIMASAALLLLCMTLLLFLRIWQRRPQPRFLFLTEEWLAQEVDLDALLIRDESVYKAPLDGIFRAFIPQGSRVSKDAWIGQILPEGDLEQVRKLDKANNDVNDRRYELLAEGRGGNAARVFEAGENSIHRNLHVFYDQMAADDYSKLAELEMELRLIMEQRLEDAQAFAFEDEELDRLISVRDRLEENSLDAIRNISSEASGIFIRQLDGLELDLVPELAMSITPQEVKSYLAKAPLPHLVEEVKAGQDLYKLSRSSDQYFACFIPASSLAKLSGLEEAGYVRVYCPANGITIKKANIVRFEAAPDGALLILQSRQNLESFVSMRKAPLTLYANESKGLRVPKTALVDYSPGNLEAGLKLVDGGYVQEARVKIVSTNEEYALVESLPDSPYKVEVSTMILLNPDSMQAGEPLTDY
ncbi:MAG: HlyD family efflux transporter periplasmic adaptor subunit [Eubacteriales bacterium]|nr:HlyD family efflux transporter periplasmic adaptor subunit [Clostridiales bacterium]MDY5836832.1 HlyD family efflux transporter periplasmic adaptor subunit [Eubacteriales bacterium]